MSRQTLETVVALVRKHPGLDAIALKGKGYRPNAGLNLRVVEQAGLIRYDNGGWFVTEKQGGQP